MSDTADYERFQGRLLWADIPFGTKQRELTAIDRAILRRDGSLAMQFLLDGSQYEVRLQKARDGTFRGTWTRGSGANAEHGHAECNLGEFRKEGGPPDEAVKLEGKWFEDIDWRWFGRLERVSHFTTTGPGQ
jgi:hypothetical protein